MRLSPFFPSQAIGSRKESIAKAAFVSEGRLGLNGMMCRWIYFGAAGGVGGVPPLASGFLPRFGLRSTRLARCQAWSLSGLVSYLLAMMGSRMSTSLLMRVSWVLMVAVTNSQVAMMAYGVWRS
jgi:hypothetical protein